MNVESNFILDSMTLKIYHLLYYVALLYSETKLYFREVAYKRNINSLGMNRNLLITKLFLGIF